MLDSLRSFLGASRRPRAGRRISALAFLCLIASGQAVLGGCADETAAFADRDALAAAATTGEPRLGQPAGSADGDAAVTAAAIDETRPAPTTPAAPAANLTDDAPNRREAAVATVAMPLSPGSYGCTSSSYNAGSGSYEFTARGSIVLAANGGYEYRGFENPSKGRVRWDDAAERLRFRGGYLDDGEAELFDDERDRFRIVTPTLPGNRWTCGLD